MPCLEAAPFETISAPAPTQEFHVETITDYREFVRLKPVWDRLVDAADPRHPFLEHDWIRTWWDCFGHQSQLYILVVKSGDGPVAIAPLIQTSVRMWGIPVRRLGFFYNDHVPRAGFIVPGESADAYRAIWNHLLRNRCWDLLQLCQLPEDSETLAAVSVLASQDGCASGLWPSSESPYIRLETSWNEYFGQLETKFRANLRNRFKRLSAIGPLEAVTPTEPDADRLQAAFDLEAAGWKREAGTAISCDANLRRFYTLLAQRAAERGWLRLQFLQSAAYCVAFGYSLVYKNRQFLLKTGFDPDYAPFSPSNLLVCRVLEQAFEQGIEVYDFLGDSADWKQRWTSDVKRHYWLFVFANTFKGRLLHAIKFRLVPLAKSFLGKEARR